MAGRPLRVLAVGGVKHGFIREGVHLYFERLKRWRSITLSEVRDADAGLSEEARRQTEGERLLKALGRDDLPLVLDEQGEQLSSRDLALLLRKLDQEGRGRPCFLVGGPFGLAQAVQNQARRRISLSSMTLPHELARLVLLEQLYRAECILRHVPYHH